MRESPLGAFIHSAHLLAALQALGCCGWPPVTNKIVAVSLSKSLSRGSCDRMPERRLPVRGPEGCHSTVNGNQLLLLLCYYLLVLRRGINLAWVSVVAKYIPHMTLWHCNIGSYIVVVVSVEYGWVMIFRSLLELFCCLAEPSTCYFSALASSKFMREIGFIWRCRQRSDSCIKHAICTVYYTGWPKKLSHYHESSLNRIKTRHESYNFHQFRVLNEHRYMISLYYIFYVLPNLWRHHVLFEAAIWVKPTHMIKSCLKTRKKEKLWIFFHKSTFKISFRHRCHSLLTRAYARGSADIIYRIWRISLVCGSLFITMRSESRSRI